MENQLESVVGIPKKTADRMKTAGIYSIEKLASMKVEELVKLKGINIKTAVRYIENAKKILEEKNSEEEIKYKTNQQGSTKEKSEISPIDSCLLILKFIFSTLSFSFRIFLAFSIYFTAVFMLIPFNLTRSSTFIEANVSIE